jgi:soluble lytic murein transglycosylase-like protein
VTNNHRSPPISIETARALVKRWRLFFPRAPASVCLTLMEIESSFIPTAHAPPTAEQIANHAPASGAWGLLQLLQPTAADMMRKLSRLAHDPAGGMPGDIVEALELWDPDDPACMTNPVLGSLLGVVYLDHLAERFGPGLERLATAYHNGAGFLRDFMAAGGHLPDDLPPRGKLYVLRACHVWHKYADADADGPPPAVA